MGHPAREGSRLKTPGIKEIQQVSLRFAEIASQQVSGDGYLLLPAFLTFGVTGK
jgi:hypothetical protein